MAGSTPIYGFPYPQPSDLVANYPALGQQLAEDVETEIAAIPPGGLVHIATESFSAASTVSLNNCFSATYQNYRVTMTTVASVASNIAIRYRTGGTDNSTSNYTNTGVYAGAGVAVASEATSGNASIAIGVTARARRCRVFDICLPFAADRTFLSGINTEADDGASNIYIAASLFQGTTSFDGFSLLPNTGTITGTIRVYGYLNS
jgi:hypothetical protein